MSIVMFSFISIAGAAGFDSHDRSPIRAEALISDIVVAPPANVDGVRSSCCTFSDGAKCSANPCRQCGCMGDKPKKQVGG